jgi:hypothetical protein
VSTETHPIQTSTDENQVEMKATKTRQNESQAAAVATRSNETTRVLSIFLVNDLQYDIFPVHPENGSMCDMDTGKYPSMGFDVKMAMRIDLGLLGCNSTQFGKWVPKFWGTMVLPSDDFGTRLI